MPKTFDIVMAVFDVGSHVVTQAAASISGSTSLDVQATLTSMFNSQIDSMGIGELIGLGMETMIISLCMKIMSVLIEIEQANKLNTVCNMSAFNSTGLQELKKIADKYHQISNDFKIVEKDGKTEQYRDNENKTSDEEKNDKDTQ